MDCADLTDVYIFLKSDIVVTLPSFTHIFNLSKTQNNIFIFLVIRLSTHL